MAAVSSPSAAKKSREEASSKKPVPPVQPPRGVEPMSGYYAKVASRYRTAKYLTVFLLVLLLLGGLIMTLLLDVPLTLILATVIPLIGIVVTFITRKGIPLFGELQKKVDGLVRVTRENVTGARVIKALSMNGYEVDRFSEQNKNVAGYDSCGLYPAFLIGRI